jgi:hypothetical protein
MQFPDDVLGIIRTYSRPQMQYVNEFCKGVRKVDPNLHGIQYLYCDVKQKLFTHDAKIIIDAWTIFADASDFTNKIRWTSMFDQTGKIDQERIQEIKRRKTIQDTKEQDLRFLVYGEKRWR